MPVIFAEGPCNTRCHAGNDDADVLRVVGVILRDGREDIRPARVKLHQVAGSTVGLVLEGCVDLIKRCHAVFQAFLFSE